MEIRKLRDAFGEWLNRYDWEWFITLTFKRPQSLDSSKSSFYGYLRRLKSGANHFTVFEGEKSTLHVHSLLGNTEIKAKKVVEDKWEKKYGIAHVAEYDKGKGARYYMTKSINSPNVFWDIDINDKKEDDTKLIVRKNPKIYVPGIMEDL